MVGVPDVGLTFGDPGAITVGPEVLVGAIGELVDGTSVGVPGTTMGAPGV